MGLGDMGCACNAVFEEVIWVLEALYTSGIGHMVKILLQEGPDLMVRFDYEEGAVGGIRRTSRINKQDVTLGELLIEHRLKKLQILEIRSTVFLAWLPGKSKVESLSTMVLTLGAFSKK
jgi:hypothetical protein